MEKAVAAKQRISVIRITPPQQLGGMFVVPFEVLMRDLHRIVEDAGKVIGCSWFELTYSKVKVFGEEHIINVVILVI